MKQPIIEAGTKVFIIESNRFVTETEVLRRSGEFYTIRFGSNVGIKARRSRIFLSHEETEAKLPSKTKPQRTYCSPHDYGV